MQVPTEPESQAVLGQKQASESHRAGRGGCLPVLSHKRSGWP